MLKGEEHVPPRTRSRCSSNSLPAFLLSPAIARRGCGLFLVLGLCPSSHHHCSFPLVLRHPWRFPWHPLALPRVFRSSRGEVAEFPLGFMLLLRLAGNVARVKALDRYSGGVFTCSVKHLQSRTQVALVWDPCAAESAGSSTSAVKRFCIVRAPHDRYLCKYIFTVKEPLSKIILWFCFFTGKTPQD